MKSFEINNKGGYITPLCTSIEVENEGLLCASPGTGIDDWLVDDKPLN